MYVFCSLIEIVKNSITVLTLLPLLVCLLLASLVSGGASGSGYAQL